MGRQRVKRRSFTRLGRGSTIPRYCDETCTGPLNRFLEEERISIERLLPRLKLFWHVAMVALVSHVVVLIRKHALLFSCMTLTHIMTFFHPFVFYIAPKAEKRHHLHERIST